jgi:outer membrane protein assembly factor BamE (lipoprotein component of BamABCDE complex)
MVRTARLVNSRALLLVAAALGLGACAYMPPLPERPRDIFTAPITNRGHAVTEEQLQQINVGVSTRADVQALLGSPSHSGTFSDENWYYISSVTRLRPGQSLAVRDRRVVVVNFDSRGTVREVRQLGDADMRNVAFVDRETPTPGTERTLLQALFGNVGRVGPNLGPQQQTPGSAGGGSGGR